MADNVETLVVAIQTDGDEKLVDLAAKADQVTAATNRARDARDRFVGGSGGGGGSSSPEAEIADGMTKAARATDDLADKAEKGGSKVAGFGQSMLQSGRFIQDFAQGGVAGVLNNIEGLTVALGLGSGLAGVLTIAGVGLSLFKDQIKDAFAALTAGGVKEFSSQLETLNARIKELEDKPHKLTVDVQELDAAKGVVENIKAALAAVDKLRKGQGHYEKESGAAIQSMIAESEGGSQGVHQKLRDAMQGEAQDEATAPIVAQRKALEKKIAANEALAEHLDATGPVGASEAVRRQNESLRKQVEQLETNRIAAANDVMRENGPLDKKIGTALNEATEGAGLPQKQAQAKLAGMLDRAGLGNLATGVRSAGPEQLLLNDQADDDLEASIEAQKAGAKRRKEAAEREKKREEAAAKAAKEKKKADGAPMDDAVRIFKGEQQAAREKRKVDGAPMDDAVRIFKGQQAARKKAGQQFEAQQKEDLATRIHYESGGGFNPDQSRQIAGKAIHMAKMNGDLSSSLVMAVSEMEATIAHLAGRFEQQQQHMTGVRGHNQQVNRRLQQGQPSLLNSGGGY